MPRIRESERSSGASSNHSADRMHVPVADPLTGRFVDVYMGHSLRTLIGLYEDAQGLMPAPMPRKRLGFRKPIELIENLLLQLGAPVSMVELFGVILGHAYVPLLVLGGRH